MGVSGVLALTYRHCDTTESQRTLESALYESISQITPFLSCYYGILKGMLPCSIQLVLSVSISSVFQLKHFWGCVLQMKNI